MKITLKRIQIYPRMSQETTAFNADVYVDEVKVGEASNEGQGGCNMYNWKDHETGQKVEQFAKETHPNDFEPLDYIVADLLDKFEEEKHFRRLCKTKTVIRLKSDENPKSDGKVVYRTFNAVYIPDRHREIIKTKYSDNLQEIINDRFL
jgi:hypothetical protein